MRVSILTLAFCLQICYGYSQSKSPVAQRKDKVSVYQGVDSTLRAENQLYKLKEDYYSDALSDQASRFGSIVSVQSTVFSVVVGLIGVILGFQLLSFRRKLETEIDVLKTKVQTIEEEAGRKNDYALYRIYRSYSETLLSQADSNIVTIGVYSRGLLQCIQSFETLALSYRYSQHDEQRLSVDRYVDQAIELANRAIALLREAIEEEKADIRRRSNSDSPIEHLSFMENYRNDFTTLFDQKTINMHVRQLLNEVKDEDTISSLLDLRGDLSSIAVELGLPIPIHRSVG